MKGKKIKYAVLHFGYAEDFGCGSVVLLNRGTAFKSDEEALKSLANNLLVGFKYTKGLSDQIMPCCSSNAHKKFCSECGKRIGDMVWEVSDFKDWLQGLLTETNDSIGYSVYDDNPGIIWELGYSASELIGTAANEVLCLNENADLEICSILGLEE